MTDDERAEAELWAEVGRRVNALAEELTKAGLFVTVVWDRPHGQVTVRISDGIG